MVNSYYYDGNQYIPRSQTDGNKGFIMASAASSAIMGTILPLCGKPFERQLIKEHSQNYLYKDAFLNSLKVSGLDKKGVRIIPMELSKTVNDYSLGRNAAYFPKERVVRINTDKISAAGFHELGHAMNDITGKAGKFLSKLRWPGRIAAGWMGTIALFSTPKPKDAPKTGYDHIKDNCGKIAFACMLPTVFEEGMASYKGIKIARKTGLAEPLIKNLKKLYGKALLTYIGHAAATGLAVGAANMIMEKFTRPKKIEQDSFYNLFI
ncbi:TPA: hypothetical protein CPT90_01515 [Candidatus Gastranaerophilales bacterium HUM_3]|jgi:hypothetical protein|nr:hypothetical protein [bacterium]OLA73300.1 MAG: hypothetical protein BHW62_06770 [Acinetobacter sp. CAG:196_36_41]DAA87245.1 MAG TPA: hypothetical protein CPT99_05225 [Candidatus Gastranaerophilales bacterium HUM_4]DAA87348.1 MAG TPA: hypothetical protein CPT90_01515 [Candidatus Gastranaerophilales bacterium HUM_3]DAA91512.1 MAG TPA: hypothetical protein CPT87_03790 [Candidatus Gastranaerophilales bacterium HUM_5]DAA98276.1 MAG TPA: hypothetical protein CPT88_02190 [Candidatus Gastranaeroph